MKKFAFAVVFALGVAGVSGVALSSCGPGGPSCKKLACSPACVATDMKTCDPATYTCVDIKTCSPVCDTGKYCDPVKGSCVDLPKACSPTCTSSQTCTDGTCKDNPVCTPTCDASAGMYCSN